MPARVPSNPPAPPFWRPRLRMMYVIFFAFLAVHLGVLLSSPGWCVRLGVAPAWRNLIWIPYPVILTLFILEFKRGDRTIHRRLAAGELPCWQCGYDLTATEAGQPCSECGGAFEAVELRDRWRTFLAARSGNKWGRKKLNINAARRGRGLDGRGRGGDVNSPRHLPKSVAAKQIR